jgi:hypothetical protein
MYEVIFKNLENNKEVTKCFDSPYLFKKFVKKITYSKKLMLLAYYCY